MTNIAADYAKEMLTTPGSEAIMLTESTRGYGVNVDMIEAGKFTFTRQVTIKELRAGSLEAPVIFETGNLDQAIGFLAGLFIIED